MWLIYFKEKGFTMLLDVGGVDYYPRSPRFEVVYHFLDMKSRGRVRLRCVPQDERPEVPSLCAMWPSANPAEREVYDLFGIVFTGHPKLTWILMPPDWEGHPLRKDYPLKDPGKSWRRGSLRTKTASTPPNSSGKGRVAKMAKVDPADLPLEYADPRGYRVESSDGDRMIISVGPHHPSTHGVLRLVLELQGERIVNCVPEIGFVHTGIEKTAENLTWQQAITVIDRMDYLSPLSNNLAYVLAVEKLLGIEVPERAALHPRPDGGAPADWPATWFGWGRPVSTWAR